MSFPQQNDPQVLHLFVNNFSSLLGSGTSSINTFYGICQGNCINFLSLYDLQTVLPAGNGSNLSTFINNGKTNYGICSFGGSIDLYDVTSNGLDRFMLIDTYNTTYPSNKIEWITLENEFWNISLTSTFNNCCVVTVNTSTVDLINGVTTATFSVGDIVNIGGYGRQIKQIVNSTRFIVDRIIPVSFSNATCLFYNTSGQLDFDTFLYRLKLLRSYTAPRGMKIEAYLARKIPSNQWFKMAPFLDRILIETDFNQSNYCLYNDFNGNKVRDMLIYCTQNRTGTITITNGTNVINGSGSDFDNDLGIGSKILCNGQIFTINTINTSTFPQQATTIETATATIVNGTFTTYFDFAPIFYVNYPQRQSWLTTPPNSKSYVDVYRLFTINGYTIGSNTQSGNSPICYNNETNTNVNTSTNLVGLSIFDRTYVETIDGSVASSPVPCSSCLRPTVFTIQTTSINPTCDNAVNGMVTVSFNPTNLQSPYIYNFTNGSTNIQITDTNSSYTFSGLTSGIWFIFVTDFNGVSSNSTFITLTETFNPTITTSSGNIIFHLIGGTEGYYISSWPYGRFFESNLLNGNHTYTSNTGTFSFVIGDSNSCVTDPISVTVTGSINLGITANKTNPTCDTASNGTITTIINSVGVAPYTYTYSRSGGPTIIHNNINSTTDTYSTAIAGTWTVSVTDSSLNISNVINLTLFNTYNPTLSTSINQVCFNLLGGVAPYNIVGNTIPPFIQNGITSGSHCYSVPSGNYIFTVTDFNGCNVNLPATINGGGLNLNLASYINPNCDLTENGSITVIATGGIPPYIYSITNGILNFTNTTGIFNNMLWSSSWSLTAQDSFGTTSNIINLTLIDKFYVNYTTTGSTICITTSGGSIGSYTVDINGILYPYNTGSTINCYSGICGENSIKVIDGDIINTSISGCVYNNTIILTCNLDFNITGTSVSCSDINGSIIIEAINGVSPYTYYISNSTQSTLNNNTGFFYNLPGLIWDVTVVDMVGTTGSTIIDLTQSLKFSADTTLTGFCLTILGGNPPYLIRNSTNNPNMNDITYYTANTMGQYCFSLDCGYNYAFNIFDISGCTTNSKAKILPCILPIGIDIVNIINPTCYYNSDGSIIFSGVNGTLNYVGYSAYNGTVLYTSTTGGTFTNLSGGSWTLYLEDSNNSLTSTTINLSSLFSASTYISYSGINTSLCVSVPSNPYSSAPYVMNINNNLYSIPTDNVNYCFPITGCGIYNISVSSITCSYNTTINISGFTSSLSADWVNGSPAICASINVQPLVEYEVTINGISYIYNNTITPNCFVTTGCGIYDVTICSSEANYDYIVKSEFDNLNGAIPYGGLIKGPNGVMYGTTYGGGTYGGGTIFSCDTSGNYRVLVNLDIMALSPTGSLLQLNNGIFYGTYSTEFNFFCGGIFSCDTVGNFGVLHQLTGVDGSVPLGNIILGYDNNMYGLTSTGGLNNNGVIFSCDTIGNYGVLYNFSGLTDGGIPGGSLILGIDNIFYGLTSVGGLYNNGVLFKYDSSFGYQVVHNFSGSTGSTPQGSLTQDINGVFYGTTLSGGLYGYGVIFSCSTYGNYGVIYNFNNTDGANPSATLLLTSDGFLYGHTTLGGSSNFGVIFKCSKIGQYTILKNLSGLNGKTPQYGPILEYSSGNLYGMTAYGGSGDYGVIFNILRNGTNGCCVNSIMDLSILLPQPNVQTVWNNNIPTIEITIDTNNYLKPPYSLSIDSIPYVYDTTYSSNTYSLPTCGLLDVSVSQLLPNTGTTYQVLHIFSGGTTDGSNPFGSLTEVSTGLFFGLAENEGKYNSGVIFSCNTNGNYGVTYNFSGGTVDGKSPLDSLTLLPNGNMYGMTYIGGINNLGTIFTYNTINGYSKIFDFSNTKGINPLGNLTYASDNNFYGLTWRGGLNNYGVIFSCSTSGNYGVIYNFDLTSGGEPYESLLEVSNGVFYGVTTIGGTHNNGVLFSCNTIGGYGVIHHFGGTINNDGDFPRCTLIKDPNNIIYGTTYQGGVNGLGTIFTCDTNGNYGVTYNFTVSPEPNNPVSFIRNSNGVFYGITEKGGTSSNGTIYTSITLSNIGIIHNFAGSTSDGGIPLNSLIQASDGNIYGMTRGGGLISQKGIIYGIKSYEFNYDCNYNVTIDVPCTPPLTLNTLLIENPTCGFMDGTIEILGSGGLPNYVYEITNGFNIFTLTGNTNNPVIFNGLTGGTWSLLLIDSSGNTITENYLLSSLNVMTYIVGSTLHVSLTGSSSPYEINIDGHLIETQYNNSFNVFYTATCDTNHTLMISDNNKCQYLSLFVIPCNEIGINLGPIFNSFCYNELIPITLISSGGSGIYTYYLKNLPTTLIYSSDTTSIISIPSNGDWYGEVIDSVGNIAVTPLFTLSSNYFVDIQFTPTNVTITFSGAAGTNILINGIPVKTQSNGVLSDGTYQYPIHCGVTNIIQVIGIESIEVWPTNTCTYLSESFSPCNLLCDYTLDQPLCPGQNAPYIRIYVTGGTPDYIYSLTNGISTYVSAPTSSTNYLFNVSGGVIITQGTWILSVMDSNGDSCSHTIMVTSEFYASVTAITNGICFIVQGTVPPYSLDIDGNNVLSNDINNNQLYCLDLICGPHNLTFIQEFVEGNCTIDLNVEIPCNPLSGSTIYSNPTCNTNESGSIEIIIMGGSPNYLFNITNGIDNYSFGPTPLKNYIFSNLGVGTWDITVTDSLGGVYTNTINLIYNFIVTASGYTNGESHNVGNICIDITGGLPPYDIYIDSILQLSGTTLLSNCFTGSCGTNHTFMVVDSTPPCTIFVNEPIMNNSGFINNSDWLITNNSNCLTQLTASTIVGGGSLTYTSTTTTDPNLGGCIQSITALQDYIYSYGTPTNITYLWELNTGIIFNYVYITPNLLTPFGDIGLPINNFSWISNNNYSGIITIPTTIIPLVYSGFGISFSNSMSYNSYAPFGELQLHEFQLTIISYQSSCNCEITGSTYIPCPTLPQIGLISYLNPNCDNSLDGEIIVSGTNGIPPYIYSATNGTLIYTNNTGIFTGLTTGTWYLSLIDLGGAISTLNLPIILYDTFYGNVISYSNGFCVTITGGTQPYNLTMNGNPLVWNYNNITNCYTANCGTSSVIIISDAS